MSVSPTLVANDLKPLRRNPIYWSIVEVFTIVKRNLLHIPRSPEEIVSSTAQPVLFVILFRYVFGGAINVGGVSYIDYLMAGIFVQTVTFTSMSAGIGFASDLEKGLIDRFRSLPISRSSVLIGHAITGLFRNVFVVGIMLIVGILVGFRPHGTFLDWLGVVGYLLLFSFAITWLGIALAILIRSREAVTNIGLTLVFPLTFLSSAFVPTQTMPTWLQIFADHQPLTSVMNAVRNLALDQPVGASGWQAVAWAVGIIIVVAPFAVAAYQRTMVR